LNRINSLLNALVLQRAVATVSALAVIAIGCGAGIWQIKRAETKIESAAKLLARQQMPILSANSGPWTLEEASDRRMIARGHYLPEASIWLDNRPRPVPAGGQGATAQAGFVLMMPFRLEGGDEILWVNRGWAPRNNQSRELLPNIQTPGGIVSIEGLVFAHPGKVYALGAEDGAVDPNKPRIAQNFDLVREAQLHHWKQAPFILRLEESGLHDGLLREWAPLTTGVDRHYAYAFQWFALACAGFLFWLINGLRQYWQQSSVNEDLG
jgi:cytochrome oxidase assembly protein ShyY1